MKRNSSQVTRKKKGFTLVDLVVVIAVLAILAGVGVVAYNGYIEYTKKGKDRETVGEIMHALELADYADPNLFGEDGGAMIVISTKNTDAAGLSEANTTALKSALEDALGEGGLTSTKLSYDKWSGTANMNVFAGLGTEGSQIETYWNNLNDKSKGVSAAFAEDFEEYWKAFEVFVNNPIDASGGKVDTNDIVKQVVDYYKGSGVKKFDADAVINNWKSGNLIGVGGFAGMDLNLARNYAFISYLKQQNLSADARTAVDNYLKTHPYDVLTPVTDFDNWCNDANVKTELQKYVTDYNTNQAEADARAYFGLMEAAAQVQKNLKEGYTDADFLAALDPYVPMVSNVLTGKTDLKAIQELAKTTDGSVVIISATKKNGVLSFSVSPKDANPRGDKGTDMNTTDDGTCSLNHTGNLLAMLGGDNYDRVNISTDSTGLNIVSTIELCKKDESKPSTCTITPSSDYFESVTVTVVGESDVISVTDKTITALKSGSAQVTITGTISTELYEGLSSAGLVSSKTISTTFTVNVHGN